MRIVHTCLRYPPSSGGAERYVFEIVERTRRMSGHDARVLTSKLRTHQPVSALDPEQLLDDSPFVQRLHYASTPFLAYPRLQALSYYLGHHQPDIIHGYGFWYQPSDVAARYAVKKTLPFLFHPLYYENEVRRKPIWQLYKKTIGYLTFQAAAVVIVISPHEQSLIEQADFPVKRFELIPPGIDIDPYNQVRDDPFVKRGIIYGPRLIAVGRLAIGKCLDQIIAAMPAILKHHPATQLALVGDDFGARGNLQQQAADLGVGRHVHFWGTISDAELVSAYQHADLLVHPSRYEAFGLVLAESLAAKTTVVARNSAAIPYVVPHRQAGLLFNTQDELIENIIELLGDAQTRLALARWGYQYVRRNFTWHQSIKKLDKLYLELGQ